MKPVKTLPRILASLALVATSALAPTAARAQETLEGEFSLATLDGASLPAPSPDFPGLTIESVTLRLSADRFELASTFSTGGDSLQAAPAIAGPWERTDEELRFFPEQSSPETVVTFRYAWDGPRLVLTDPNGHRWTLERVEG